MQQFRTKTITFLVTEDCQLRCKYCYIVGKNSLNKMSLELAQKAVDYILSNRRLFNEEQVVWDFIGGEPLLQIEMIDRLCDYIKIRMFELDHPWFNAYMINFSTNGLLYQNYRVQNFIEKNKAHLSIGISIDGTKQKHDEQRVYADGRGSYEDVIKVIPLWLQQFPEASTKSTVSHYDIPYIKDSVLHLWKIGIKYVNINVVFEDVWEVGDDKKFEDQLIQLADAILDNNLYVGRTCSFFQRGIGRPIDLRKDNHNWCGAGKMLAIDYKGDFLPCIRFAEYSLSKKHERTVGNIYTGIDENKLRPFIALNRSMQSNSECLDCQVASGCAWCQGGNYEMASNDTIYQRATFICKMHKARVRANNYYWNKFDSIKHTNG